MKYIYTLLFAAVFHCYAFDYSSLVRIQCSKKDCHVDSPWFESRVTSSYGSGVVIGDSLVLTCAHVVDGAKWVDVQLGLDSDKYYKGRVISSGYDCDLAVVSVEDPEFVRKSKAVKIGSNLSIGENITACGFDDGKITPSVTKGSVVRNCAMTNLISTYKMPHTQIQTVVWAGCSGGPVFSDNDELVGIVSQMEYSFHPMVSSSFFSIPSRVMRKFIEQSIQEGEYAGLPYLPIRCSPLFNKSVRKLYGMKDDLSGAIVSDLVKGKYCGLKKNDIILDIAGYDVSNNGLIESSNGDKVPLEFVLFEDDISDSIPVTILRKKTTKTIDIKLDHRYSKPSNIPPYFIFAGLVFQPYCSSIFDEGQVYLTKVLFHEINRGYEKNIRKKVERVNGKVVVNIMQLIHILNNSKGVIKIEMSDNIDMYFDKKEAEACKEEILNLYDIHFDRSAHFR